MNELEFPPFPSTVFNQRNVNPAVLAQLVKHMPNITELHVYDSDLSEYFNELVDNLIISQAKLFKITLNNCSLTQLNVARILSYVEQNP